MMKICFTFILAFLLCLFASFRNSDKNIPVKEHSMVCSMVNNTSMAYKISGSIYNVLGKEIRNRNKNFKPGVYYRKVITGNTVVIQKIVIY